MNFSPSLAAPAAACPRAAPSWRILALLAALVLLAHALALGASPANFGPTPPAAQTVPVMLTRSLSLPPLAAPTQAKPATPTPAAARSPAQAAANPPPTKPLAAQKAPTPAPQAPQTSAPPEILETLAANDGPPQSSADPFSGLEQGSGPEEAPLPQAPPQSSTKAQPASSTAAATPPPAAPPGKPGQHPVSPVGPITLPASVDMGYQVTGNVKGLTYHAKGELLWRHNASSYQTQMSVKALLFGSRGMSSQGQLDAEGLAPTRFEDKGRNEVAAHFESGKGQISFSANTPSVPWVKGAQDRASVLIQLGAMLAGNPTAFPAGSSISVYTVGPRDAETWTFLVEDGEVLALPFGPLATIKLSRQLRNEHDKKLEVWYAPSLGYLPVRNKLSEASGDFVDQQLSSLSRP
ncbi:MAG: DUF3108 domain-containing protein [Polaromonas sp.]|nr:DUF3108 domain-containing protein [Polaromonas sp.]